MNTVVDILSARVGGGSGAHASACKLMLAMIWLHGSDRISVVDLAVMVECSERCAYRAMAYLKDCGFVYHTATGGYSIDWDCVTACGVVF